MANPEKKLVQQFPDVMISVSLDSQTGGDGNLLFAAASGHTLQHAHSPDDVVIKLVV